MNRSITETMDIIRMIDAFAETIILARQDGRYDWADLPKAASLMVPMIKALNNAGDVKEELADLDQEEVAIIVEELIGAVKKLMKGFV